MTAQPFSLPETSQPDPDLRLNPSDVECIHVAAELPATSLQDGV